MSLNVTPGDAAAESYASVAEATTYNAAHLYGSAWTGASLATQESALRMSCLFLDAYPRGWTGASTLATQKLVWPRIGMLNRNGFPIDSMIIPFELKAAQSEFARQLIQTDSTANNAIINKGITSIRAGSVSLTFQDLVEGDTLSARTVRELNALIAMFPDAVKLLLVPSWLNKDPEDAIRNTFTFKAL